MSIIHHASVKISITYSERLNLNKPYDDRPILSAVKTIKKFEVINASTYLQEAPATEETITGLLNQVDQGIDEAFALFKKVTKTASDVRLDVWIDRETYDNETYREVVKPQNKAFWLVKNYTFSKSVTVRRGIPGGGSVNTEGGNGLVEYEGKVLARALRQEKSIFLLGVGQFLQNVLVNSFDKEAV